MGGYGKSRMWAFNFWEIDSEFGMVLNFVAVRSHGYHEIHIKDQRIQINKFIFKMVPMEQMAVLRISGDIPGADSSRRFRRVLIWKSGLMILSVPQACRFQSSVNPLHQRDDPSRSCSDCCLRLTIPVTFSEPKIVRLKILKSGQKV
jgi:hypothetical protein